MATAQEIGRAGEAHVVRQLAGQALQDPSLGTTLPSAADIGGSGGQAAFLSGEDQRVTQRSPIPSGEETAAMKARPVELGAEPGKPG